MSTISFTTNSDPWGRCFCDFEGAEVNVFFVHIFSLIPLQVHHLESLISVNLRGSAVSSWEKQVDWMFNDNKHRFFSLFSRFFALVWSKVNSTDKSMWPKHEGDWPLFFSSLMIQKAFIWFTFVFHHVKKVVISSSCLPERIRKFCKKQPKLAFATYLRHKNVEFVETCSKKLTKRKQKCVIGSKNTWSNISFLFEFHSNPRFQSAKNVCGFVKLRHNIDSRWRKKPWCNDCSSRCSFGVPKLVSEWNLEWFWN